MNKRKELSLSFFIGIYFLGRTVFFIYKDKIRNTVALSEDG